MTEFNSKKNKKPPFDKIKWLSICPFCNTKFNINQAKVIAEKKDSFLVHAHCKKCRCSVLASLVNNRMGISSIGLVIDLTYEDVLKFKNARQISIDDTLEAYQDLYK